MRIYIIGNDGITLYGEAPATLNDGEIAVASNGELHAAPLSGKRLLALWNALPDVEKRRKVGDRGALIDRLWSAGAGQVASVRQFQSPGFLCSSEESSALAVTAESAISLLVRLGSRRIAWLLAEGSSWRALKLSKSSSVQAGSMPFSQRRTSKFSRNPVKPCEI